MKSHSRNIVRLVRPVDGELDGQDLAAWPDDRGTARPGAGRIGRQDLADTGSYPAPAEAAPDRDVGIFWSVIFPSWKDLRSTVQRCIRPRPCRLTRYSRHEQTGLRTGRPANRRNRCTAAVAMGPSATTRPSSAAVSCRATRNLRDVGIGCVRSVRCWRSCRCIRVVSGRSEELLPL